ncbi:hypothetical protein K458DRAFT_403479 [Lentithecium fluviatile CBS 122367]|uniref:Uncharacterized protein n=1 Tax=Lentithecium fluviatile CBS 122367 TaxID=1168545 RepID=A0A6G1J4W5_9PLEO|nr:hypothetical protein K458DRAFT_403479 [Lentithecium fluviatile CBS 122367]
MAMLARFQRHPHRSRLDWDRWARRRIETSRSSNTVRTDEWRCAFIYRKEGALALECGRGFRVQGAERRACAAPACHSPAGACTERHDARKAPGRDIGIRGGGGAPPLPPVPIIFVVPSSGFKSGPAQTEEERRVPVSHVTAPTVPFPDVAPDSPHRSLWRQSPREIVSGRAPERAAGGDQDGMAHTDSRRMQPLFSGCVTLNWSAGAAPSSLKQCAAQWQRHAAR